jgi:hypothetical protein
MNGLGILILIVVGAGVAVFWCLNYRAAPHRGDRSLDEAQRRDIYGSGGGGMSSTG